jgi:DNA-binding NarL/FixJ family response regulator
MEASPTVGVGRSSPDTVIMGVVTPDESLSERLTEVATAAGVDVRIAVADVDSLLADSGLSDLTTVVVQCTAAEGAATVEKLRETLPDVSLVVMPAQSGARMTMRRLVDAGADGIVLDSQLEAALATTLAAIQSGQVVLPREMVNRGQAPLSFREKQILALVVMGFTNAGIATKLFLAESTVKSHLSSAFTKLGVRSRHEAAALLADPQQMGLGVLTIARD